MEILQPNHWSTVINIILQSYFSELTTTCILWPKNFDFHLNSTSTIHNVYLHINPLTLTRSFGQDVYNFTAQDEHYNSNGVYYNDLIKKYIASIEHSHCEGFLAFQDDISLFAATFLKASLYSKWRSLKSCFVFAYIKDKQEKDYFQEQLFKDQPNILIIEADCMNSSKFSLKTPKFVGSIFENPAEMIPLSTFNALNNSFSPPLDLFSPFNKFQNLHGREIIVGAFDYRPFVSVDFNRSPLYFDHAANNPSHFVHVDGTEIRICHTFCEIYNCSVQFDTSESEEWGSAYDNYTAYGMIKMIMDAKVHLAMGAMFPWYSDYVVLDHTFPMGRSGITCLVPAPTSIVSWTLPVRPFKFTLWLAVFALLLLESLALLTARYFEQSMDNSNKSWRYCYKFGFITTLKLFVSQGSDYVVNSHTVRTVLFACYMIDIIITSIYGGGLSAILTIPTLEEAADSKERLYRHNLPWSATSYAWVESIRDETYDPIIKKLYDNFVIMNGNEMLLKTETKTMAFAIERMAYGHFANMDFMPSDSLRRLKLMIDDIYWSHTVAFTSRLWPFLAKYNDLILAWRSSGFDKYWEWKMTANYLNINKQTQVKTSQYENEETGPIKLGMDNFDGLILLWLVGIALSILVFMGEVVVDHIKGEREKNN